MLACTICWELYESKTGIIVDGCSCPKRECLGQVADIDELILPAIILLNEKGYFTEYCCSGHFHSGTSTSAYILFDQSVKQVDVPALPKGFTFDTRNQNLVCIRRELRAKDRYDLHRKAVEASVDVLEWVKSLPEMPDM